jgi:hypothetical protein
LEALLAFVAMLVSLRLSAELFRRFRARRATHLAAWAGALAAYAVAAGGLLTAPLLGAGSLLFAGRRLAGPIALAYVGLAVGIAVAVPLEGDLYGSDVPEAQDVLELWPARIVAIAGNAVGTLAVVGVAVLTFRRRPLGNGLILAGVGVAAIGSGFAGLGVGALAPILVVAALLLYAGFVAPTAAPRRPP